MRKEKDSCVRRAGPWKSLDNRVQCRYSNRVCDMSVEQSIHANISSTTRLAGKGHTDSRVNCRWAASPPLLIVLKAQFYKLVS